MKSRTKTTEDLTLVRFKDWWAGDKVPGRIRSPSSSLPECQALARAYLRDLRAAEMNAWEMTGGDYLISQGNKRKL
jgi:hypothetical protein